MRKAVLVLATACAFAAPVAAEPLRMTPWNGERAQALPPKQGFSYPDCYCTDSVGRRVEIGQHACLQVGGRNRFALCDMSQNNPTWRFSEDPCPIS